MNRELRMKMNNSKAHIRQLFHIVCSFFCNSRFVMRSLNISGRRLVTMDEVDEMIKAVDDGDGLLNYSEFVNLIQKH